MQRNASLAIESMHGMRRYCFLLVACWVCGTEKNAGLLAAGLDRLPGFWFASHVALWPPQAIKNQKNDLI